METLLCSQMKNAPVIDRLSGRLLGYVKRVVTNLPGKRISGVVLESPGGVRRQYYLARGDIFVLSYTCVVAREPRLKPLREAPAASPDYQLVSFQGRPQGRINDYLIDSTGGICGFEISKSLVEDVKNGREILPIKGNLMVAEDKVQLLRPSSLKQNDKEGTNELY